MVSRILKLDKTFKELCTMTIYAVTLSSIIYVIYLLFSYFTSFTIPYFYVIDILIVYVYIGLILNKRKLETGK